MTSLWRVMLATTMLACAGLAQAQAAFPGKAITIIVPATPGGILDQSAVWWRLN